MNDTLVLVTLSIPESIYEQVEAFIKTYDLINNYMFKEYSSLDKKMYITTKIYEANLMLIKIKFPSIKVF